MSMYKLTRQEVAEKLNVSTRSVDRYIRSWKLRSKKEWKIVYVSATDVNSILSWPSSKQEVIIPKAQKVAKEEKVVVRREKSVVSSDWTLDLIYKDLRDDIGKKDLLIQGLAEKLWRSDELTKNSVSLIEFKKSQFLLEESKTYLSKEIHDMKKDKNKLEKELKKEKGNNLLLLILVIVLIAIASVIWFIQI